jgi:ABC-type Fe3+/spermidine/putrescine transport system ATPase subunit
VAENVGFGLEVRGVARVEARARVSRILDAVNLAGFGDRYPSQLSGGQQQRVALARSLVVEPSILLLDEPLSNLDAKLRERMRWELKDLQRRTGITFVYVTHDQAEAMALSDRIAVMHEGRLQQCGPPREVYARPANRIVADFMGLVNLLPGRIARVTGDESHVIVCGTDVLGVALPPGAGEGQAVQIAIRPESIRLAPLPGAPAGLTSDAVAGKVVEVTFLGNLTDCYVALDGGTRVRVQAEPGAVFDVGQPVLVRFDGGACTVFCD